MSLRGVSFTMRFILVLALLCGSSLAWAKVQKGQRAPGFSLTTLKGEKLSLSSLAGQVVLIDFWAQWCEPCKHELPELDKLQKEYAQKGVRILAINIDKQRDNADKLVRMLGLSIDVPLDPAGSVAATYDLPKMPTSYLVDKKGVVRFVHEGFENGDVARFKKELDELTK